MDDNRIKVGITHGDLCGVGYEVILKTFFNPVMSEMCVPVLYGSPKAATFHRKAMDLATNFSVVSSPEEAVAGRLNMVSCFDEEVKIEFGKSSPESGRAAMLSLQRALADYKEGKIDVLVTAPINKANIQGDGFQFVGHTEYLESEVGEGNESLMILMSPIMKVALVTTHLPVKEISQNITTEKIERKIAIFNQSLKNDFTISIPRIAVLSLNPHCGDNGLLGREESDVIVPAVENMRAKGVQCFGPYAADGFFGSEMYTHFDGVLAMYHDQGQIALKLKGFDQGITIAGGFRCPIVTCAHGTAYDIAGKGIVKTSAFENAVKMCTRMANHLRKEKV